MGSVLSQDGGKSEMEGGALLQDGTGMFKLTNILEDTNYDIAVRTRLIASIGPSSSSKECLQ